MTDTRQVRITLAQDQVAALKAAVASGEYATASEIVSEAIRDWQLKRELRSEETQALRELWDEGKASGRPRPLDFAELKREARRRLREQKKSGGDAR